MRAGPGRATGEDIGRGYARPYPRGAVTAELPPDQAEAVITSHRVAETERILTRPILAWKITHRPWLETADIVTEVGATLGLPISVRTLGGLAALLGADLTPATVPQADNDAPGHDDGYTATGSAPPGAGQAGPPAAPARALHSPVTDRPHAVARRVRDGGAGPRRYAPWSRSICYAVRPSQETSSSRLPLVRRDARTRAPTVSRTIGW